MESWNELFSLQEDEYLKVNVSVYKCSVYEGTSKYNEASQSSYQQEGDGAASTHTVTPKPPLLKNILGENLFSSLEGLFGQSKNGIAEPSSESEVENPCHVIKSVEIPISIVNLSFWILIALVTIISLVSAIVVVRKCVRMLWYSVNLRFQRKTVRKEKATAKAKLESDCEINDSGDENAGEQNVSLKKNSESNGFHLSYQCCVFQNVGIGSSNVITFLEQTTDKLFKKLDKLLLRGLADGQSLSQTCQATPRLARRNLTRRQRFGSSPMLQSLADPGTDSSENKETEEQECAWEVFKSFSGSLNWKFPFANLMESSNLSRSSQKLLHYYQRVCPVPRNLWKTACLVTDYVLYLISQEITGIESKSGYRFIQFMGTGSCKNGTDVARPNHFDVLMVVQPPLVPDLVYGSSEGGIPPGMVAVSVNAAKHSAYDKKIISNLDIDGSYKSCLSAKDFALASESLIDGCLHSLYTKSRSAMDRLPFQVKGAPTATLTLNINTRALVGFSDTEIKVHIIPVLPLPMNGWYQMPMLFASPPDADYEYKQRSDLKKAVNPDLLWHIKTSDFDTVFSIGVDSMMKHAGVKSCHVICLMILKSLLTGCSKNNLLDRGIFPSNHIETVINFLLLESAPSQWTFDKLGDRFSDAIHFLKSAYSCNRLPHFFVNNPHLISKMPAVAENKVLTQTRQRNLLSDVRSESLEKRLEYLESCLRETGLADCVKEEFSSDMWEFEFFLFN